ncbi:hypothetical protein [Erwinia sp. 198]|uniref:hypothetical protein n=1 Tax=Erwinia sp. 198 TaxID=2022746 RepID=UPI000F673814|nr:hypothetical protein [Erwinia sp. 198]RRZ93680.1 hypothetical protein EGK14_07760 [Erwinia sp. 198]
MTMLEQIKVLYLNDEQGEFLKYDILADQTGRAALVLVHISLQHQIGQLSWAVWTKVDELSVPLAEETPEAALRLAVAACVDHRASWQK